MITRFSKSIFTLHSLILLLVAGCATSRSTHPATQENAPSTPQDRVLPLTNLKRNVPNSINDEIPVCFKKAIKTGTRTSMGKPGADYWQQESDYDMDVKILPEQKKLQGHGVITYTNNSPDTLHQIYLELTQNLHKEGVIRNRPAEISGGMNLQSFSYKGQKLSPQKKQGQSGYRITGTVMHVTLPAPLQPGQSATIKADFNFNIPKKGAGGRMGYNSDNLIFIGYWFPKIRVYDDVIGWFKDPFLGNAEFYNEFGDYHVHITAPEQWLVAATGKLENADHVLTPAIRNRMQKAHASDSVMHVVRQKDFGNVTQSGKNGMVTWNYRARHVSDFAFSLTKESNWDATRTPVGDIDGDGTTDSTAIDAFYRNTAPLWKDAAADEQHAIKFLSNYTSLSYPWQHMTAVEGGGIIGGGMEYPMMTLIGAYRNGTAQSLYAVIAHELAHMWIPMQLASDERRYAWMDEGTTTFNENQAKHQRFNGLNADSIDFQSYISITSTDAEGPIMRHSDYHYTGRAYGVASYPKPASVLITLRGLLGEQTFNKAYHTFMHRWQFKHPYPWDLFNTFEDVSGRDLDWFWRSWYYTTWKLDQAVGSVNNTANGTRIVILDKGQIPMPATINIQLANGKTMTDHISVETWLNGATQKILTIDAKSPVARVEIDPQHLFPDANPGNNIWKSDN